MAHILTRRSFLRQSCVAGAGLALGSMLNVPGFVQQALAEGSIGLNGKKLLFIFLRGANDGLNTVIPVGDDAYLPNRVTIGIAKDSATDYTNKNGQCDVVPNDYRFAINLHNGFAGLHPALNNLASVYNEKDLAVIHRVGYPKQSRSHFDSQRYWESGVPSSRQFSEGIFYRVMAESGLTSERILTGVSVQKNIPLLLRGPIPMTNLADPTRYNLVGVYDDSRKKHLDAIARSYAEPYPEKHNRDLVYNLGRQFRETIDLFQDINFANNEFFAKGTSNHLFPIDAASNQRGVDANGYEFFKNLKSAAMILANTPAIVAGTEMGGFDTHIAQVDAGANHTGAHANLIKRIGWGIFALKEYFSNPAYNNSGGGTTGKNMWDDIVIVTLSEFGRTSAENGSNGTDHAEAGPMFVAGGAVKGGVYQCGPNDSVPWVTGPANQSGNVDGSMFAVDGRYLKRSVDYRSVLGEIIREHLGATENQLNRIIPGYSIEDLEHLKKGGLVTRESKMDNADTMIAGELDIV